MPLAGFVWEEGGKIVGNVSLVFQTHKGQKIALIANVATHPDYRRGGIGRALTQTGHGERPSERAPGACGCRSGTTTRRRSESTRVWVSPNGPAAQPTARRTGRSRRLRTLPAPATADAVRARRIVLRRAEARYWPRQHEWLERAHPEEIGWYAHWNWKTLGPGIWQLSPAPVPRHRRAAVVCGKRRPAAGNGHLASRVCGQQTRFGSPPRRTATSEGVRLALEGARRDLADSRKLTIEHPAGELVQAIQDAGFEASRTLMWMRAPATETRISRMESQTRRLGS